MIVRGAFNHLLRPGLRKDFRDSYNSYPEEYSQILKIGSQDRAEVEAVNLAGLPRMVVRGEAEPVTFLDPVMGDKVIYVDTEYALGFQITRRMVEDDLYNKARQNAKWLGRSARLTQEYAAAALIDDAFAGATFTGVNGEALCSTTHTLLNSAQVASNRLAPDVQLSVTGLQAAYDLAELTIDETGDPIPIMPDTLIINVADAWVATQLNEAKMEPYTADNNVNALTSRKGTLKTVVSHYKLQGSDWFIRDSKLSDAHFLWRVRVQNHDGMDDQTLVAFYWARQRFLTYFFDWRGWIGSSP
jgi:phage major head subunit gpT-like protein